MQVQGCFREAFDELFEDTEVLLQDQDPDIVSALTAGLAAVLPLLDGVLPRDSQVSEWRVGQLPLASCRDGALVTVAPLPTTHQGTCVVPHQHPMERRTVPEARAGYTMTGLRVYDSGRACDNCDKPIHEQYFWSCSTDCEVVHSPRWLQNPTTQHLAACHCLPV